MKYVVKGNQWVWVRSQTSTESYIIGKLLNGTVIDVTTITNGWARLDLSANGVAMKDNTQSITPAYGWVLARLLIPEGTTPPPPPPPPPPPQQTAHKLGVNVINYGKGAQDAMKLGCRAVLIMNDHDLARNLKQQYPDAVVMYRWFTSHWTLTGAELAAKQNIKAGDGLIYQGYNEGDEWAQEPADKLSLRIDYDLEWANILLSRGVKVMLGTFSMGTPDFTDAATIQQMKRYAPLYNSNPNVYFDMHNYSPYPNHPFDIWYERRWEWLFTRCGFNPLAGQKIIASETGVDKMGTGGFTGNNMGTGEFENWCRGYLAAMAQPLIVNGTSYPSPMLASTIFQYGGGTDQKWMGYDITPYGLASLAGVAW